MARSYAKRNTARRTNRTSVLRRWFSIPMTLSRIRGSNSPEMRGTSDRNAVVVDSSDGACDGIDESYGAASLNLDETTQESRLLKLIVFRRTAHDGVDAARQRRRMGMFFA